MESSPDSHRLTEGKVNMGRVRTKTVKRASRVLIEKYYPQLTLDFQVNKKICEKVAVIPSKRLRNKVAGYVTHLMQRIQRGPVRGISFKLQEEEREKRDNYVPEVSELAHEAAISIDRDTMEMLKAIGMGKISGLNVVSEDRHDHRRARPHGHNHAHARH